MTPPGDATAAYPERRTGRDRWILARRGTRNVLNPAEPYAFLHEKERSATGEIVSVATVFLTNRECPCRCVMCDLWRNTLPASVPPGAIPSSAIGSLGSASFADAAMVFVDPSSRERLIAEPSRTSRNAKASPVNPMRILWAVLPASFVTVGSYGP